MAPAGFERIRFVRDGWERSARGNLWKRLDSGETVTIFTRKDRYGDVEGYGWCVYRDDDGPTYSSGTYQRERAAKEGAWMYLEMAEVPCE